MKILIFGIPGSGKTYLAHKIAENLHLPIFHIDKFFFEKGWIERDHNRFLQDMQSVLKHEHWIIDGNGMRTLEMRFREAQIVIYCRLPRVLCLYRIFYRAIVNSGKIKKDGPTETKDSISWKLIKYLWCFPAKYKQQITYLERKYSRVQFLEVRSKRDMKWIQDGYLKTI